jgi:hypothetical protein
MRPRGLDSIRAVQAALAETVAPELTSPFAQDTAQVLQMLLESIAAEWDTGAEQLRQDNETLARLLSDAKNALDPSSAGNEIFAAIVSQIEQRLSEEEAGSIAISVLASRNEALRETLEHILVTLEDLAGEPQTDPVRTAIYRHLRDVASRGWSFWDVSSFRGRMAVDTSKAPQVTPPEAVG